MFQEINDTQIIDINEYQVELTSFLNLLIYFKQLYIHWVLRHKLIYSSRLLMELLKKFKKFIIFKLHTVITVYIIQYIILIYIYYKLLNNFLENAPI